MATQTGYTHAALIQLWEQAGGAGFLADTAAAIAQAESGGCLYAKAGPTDDRPAKLCTYRQTSGENSYGLWQINRQAHPQYSAAELYTASGNAAAAVAVEKARGDFSAWTTYTNGAYQQYLAGVPQAPPGTTGVPGTNAAASTSSHQVDQAWTRLMRTLAITSPQQLATVAAARSRIRQAVR